MIWIGLTGGIASGKSEASRVLLGKGVPVVDADTIAHLALRPGESSYKEIKKVFPGEIFATDGSIDRKALGALIFSDASQRQKLEAIVHPYVQKKVKEKRQALAAQGNRWAVYDVPLLFESRLENQFDRILVISCRTELQKQRLMKRNGLSESEAIARIQSQIPLMEKVQRADDCIENNGTLEEFHQEVISWAQSIETKYVAEEKKACITFGAAISPKFSSQGLAFWQ